MPRPSERNVTKEQKVGFTLLFLFGLIAVGLGFLQIRNTIYGPFAITRGGEEEAPAPVDEITRLQRIDTDHDGINDYEELNFWETSPYLPDTDSDGIDDKVEIDANGDPLCPQGKVCGATDSLPASPTTNPTSPLFTKNGTVSGIISLTSPTNLGANATSSEQVQALLQDPAKIRALLLSTGKISEAELAKVSDAELLQMLEKLVAQ